MANKIYGYARISTKKQNIERQITNITRAYPNAIVLQEVYTGRVLFRPQWQKLLKMIKSGDTIVFDSVSRMSRNAAEGFNTYMELYNKGINLIFLKEQTVNTDSFKSVLGNERLNFEIQTNDNDTNELVNGIMLQVATYITALAQKQIALAFEQSQKEVDDLSERTKEGLNTAAKHGRKGGRKDGQKVFVKKSVPIKDLIVKHNKTFGNGTLNDLDTIALINGTSDLKVSRNTYYKYKRELTEVHHININ